MVSVKAFVWIGSTLAVLGVIALVRPSVSSAGPNRPPHPVRLNFAHPTHPPRATRTPHGGPSVATPTPTPGTSGGSVACPAAPSFKLEARVSKLFFAYPGSSRSLTASGSYYILHTSNGVDPVADGGSLTITDDDGVAFASMPSLHFESNGSGGFAASNEQGFVTITPLAGAFAFRFQFDRPDFASDFFRVRVHVCLNIGDDGIAIPLVCQKKPRGGFLCHM